MNRPKALALFALLALTLMGTVQSGFAQPTPTIFLAITDLEDALVVMGDAGAGSPHPGTIVVLSWSWGASAELHGKKVACNLQDLSVVKFADIASPGLLMAQLDGTTYEKATLFASSPTQQDIIKFELFGVSISSISLGGSGGENRYTENVTFKFSSARYTYMDDTVPVSADIGGC